MAISFPGFSATLGTRLDKWMESCHLKGSAVGLPSNHGGYNFG